MGDCENILAVGDIHGSYDYLERVLTEVLPGLPADTRLVFLGDYIDRGPDSAKVVALLVDLTKRLPGTISLLGNHEKMLLDALAGRDEMPFLWNGGRETMQSYALPPQDFRRLPQDHQDFFRALPRYYQNGDYLFVHAGIRPGLALAEQNPRDFIWIREEFFLAERDWPYTVVFGHTPFPKPMVKPGLFGIDTGAVYGNGLTCLKLPEEELITIT